MKKSTIIALFTLMVVPLFSGAAEHAVSLDEVAKTLKTVSPGDIIYVKSGYYKDMELKWKAPGFPITISAMETGHVTVSGKSSLRICGDSLTVKGLDFNDAHPEKGNVVEFRIGKELANHCRITQCSFNACNPLRRDVVSSYIVLHGKDNRVDHCNLTGKLNLGVTLLINLNDARSLENNHRIDHNYFGPRPVYGSNGAETMRIGTSQQAYETSGTIVEENYFDGCSGEVEIISVKSSGNIIRNNVFNECQGVVALRHGKNNLVKGNLFNGNGVKNTGGVRIVDSGHTVTENIFNNLAGQRFFSALAVMNSVPNSLPNRYVQVSDVQITENLFVDCSNIEFGTGKDMERTQAPEKCLFAFNTLVGCGNEPFKMIDPLSGVEFKDNKILKSDQSVEPGIDKRLKAVYANCGVSREGAIQTTTEPNTIQLSSGVIYRSEPYIVNKPTVIKGDGTTLKWNGTSGGNFITIENGGSLIVEGVTFDGALQQGYAVVKNAISTAAVMITPYTLEVKDCHFLNMPESGCCAIKGSKGTFAEEITVSGCNFTDLSGNAISLADETDDKGRYSSEEIKIENCNFSHLLGIPVNIYRGGSDESTAGPYVTIKDCKFTDACNRERGSVLRLIGPQKLRVEGCDFIDSGRGGYSIRLDETTWEDVKVTRCKFENSGDILSNHNVVSND